MALTATIRINVDANLSTTAGLATATAPVNYSKTISFTEGTGASQANAAWSDSRTLTATSEDLDLNGVLTNAFGTLIASTAIKLLVIENTHATAELIVGGAATNGVISWVGDATDKVKIRPGGVMLLVAPDATGYGVTAGTADKLKIDAGASTIIYKIIALAEI